MVGHVVPGKSIYRDLEARVHEFEHQLALGETHLKEITEHAADLVAQRGAALLALAQHYLPEISHSTIAQTFQEIRTDLAGILSQQQTQLQQTEQALDRTESDHLRTQVELDQITEQLDAVVSQREKLAAEVAQQLAAHATFPTLSQRALQAEQELHRNEERIAEMQLEATEKLPAYKTSQLFQYLHQQGYGTPDYDPQKSKWRLTKRLDRWVAQLIDFSRTQRSYNFLRVTPQLMQAEVERRKLEFHALMEQVEAIEDNISDELGLTDVLRSGDLLGEKRSATVQTLAKLSDSKAKYQQEIEALRHTKNQYYHQAVERMQAFLATLDAWRLEQRAHRTPEPEDDALVQDILQLGAQLHETQEHANSLSQKQTQQSRLNQELQQVLTQFRSAEFDSRRSHFSAHFQLEPHLQEYQSGQLSAAQLWKTIQKNQQFTPLPSQSSRGFDLGIDRELSQLLLHSLTEVAGAALRGAAQRGMRRRGPIRRQRRIEVGRPRFPKPGFTNGRGF